MPETDQTSEVRTLPYSTGTLRDFRARILAHGFTGEKRFNELLNSTDTPLNPDECRELKLAHYACLYGYATASLLGLIADKFGDDAATEAAALVDDMGANGGAPYCEDFPYPPQLAADEPVARRFSAPAEPADVTAVVDRNGQLWVCPGEPGNNLWWRGKLGHGVGYEWHDLLKVGPLTDAVTVTA